MIGLLFYLVFIGVVAGFLARLLVPGPDPIGFGATVVLGIVGSFVGGILAALIFDGELTFRPGGVVGSIVGAVLALLVYRRALAPRPAPRRRRRLG